VRRFQRQPELPLDSRKDRWAEGSPDTAGSGLCEETDLEVKRIDNARHLSGES
jgi:hypothetical protein